MGYGSNVYSPANFRKSGEGTLHNGDVASESPKMIYEWGGTRAANGNATPKTVKIRTKIQNGTPSSSASPTAASGLSRIAGNGGANAGGVQYPQYDSET